MTLLSEFWTTDFTFLGSDPSRASIIPVWPSPDLQESFPLDAVYHRGPRGPTQGRLLLTPGRLRESSPPLLLLAPRQQP